MTEIHFTREYTYNPDSGYGKWEWVLRQDGRWISRRSTYTLWGAKYGSWWKMREVIRAEKKKAKYSGEMKDYKDVTL